MNHAHRLPVLGFRSLQAITDLRATAGRHPCAAIRGIERYILPGDRARGADTRALVRIILQQGGRLETGADLRLMDALRLAASQPDRDSAAFSVATAILLADRLQDGLGREDLGIYWDSLRDAYVALQPQDRAAIVQGFLAGAAMGKVRCSVLSPPHAHLTQTSEEVRSDLLTFARKEAAGLGERVSGDPAVADRTRAGRQLHALLAGYAGEPLTGDSPLFGPLLSIASTLGDPLLASATALLLAEAVRTGDLEGWFGVTLWSEMAEAWLQLPGTSGRAILAGLRHLYEADPAWEPVPQLHAPAAKAGRLLLPPIPTAGCQGRHQAGRVG